MLQMEEKLPYKPLEQFLQIHLFVVSVFGVTVFKINVFVMLDTLVLLVKHTQLLLVKIKLVLVFKELLIGQLNIPLLTCINKAVGGSTF
jgi:hypothetical protein